MKVESPATIKLRPTRGCQSPITADFRLLERGPESGPDSERRNENMSQEGKYVIHASIRTDGNVRERMWLAQFSVRPKVCSAKRSN